MRENHLALQNLSDEKNKLFIAQNQGLTTLREQYYAEKGL